MYERTQPLLPFVELSCEVVAGPGRQARRATAVVAPPVPFPERDPPLPKQVKGKIL